MLSHIIHIRKFLITNKNDKKKNSESLSLEVYQHHSSSKIIDFSFGIQAEMAAIDKKFSTACGQFSTALYEV
jgi:hypothetical protein